MRFHMDLALAFEDAQPFRLTVDQYQALDDSGAFEDSPRVELIEGMIVCMSPMSSSHGYAVLEIAARLRERLREIGSPLVAFAGTTVAIPPHNAPGPDISIAERQVDKKWLPVAKASLLVEVSRPAVRKDLKVKRDIYARGGVPEYWVIDIKKGVVHRFASVVDGAYRAEPPIPLAGPLASLTIPELVVDGSGIL